MPNFFTENSDILFQFENLNIEEIVELIEDSYQESNTYNYAPTNYADATENFPDSWTSHYRPSLQHNPLVFLVDQFYAIIIPLTVGGLGFLVLTDVFRRVRDRLKK